MNARNHVGLLGWPVGHSVSPAMHNAAFAALGLDWQYTALAVPPDDLPARIDRLINEDGYRGFNVTIPHKRAVFNLPGLHNISPAAQSIGAVNTLVVQPDKTLTAHNTDWRGFADDLTSHGIEVSGKRCLVLGTGGSARAVVYALERLKAASITQVSREPGSRPGVVGYDDLSRLAPSMHVIINCTPVGMVPEPDASPWPPDVPLARDAALYDLVYNPPVTRLVAAAHAAGALAVNGLGMLVRQGALAFELWTGSQPPLDVMFSAARDALYSTQTE